MSLEAEPLLEVKDFSMAFETPQGVYQTAHKLSLKLYPGEAVALVGESGCGKSAFAQALLKLSPMPPARILEGEILFKDKDLVSLNDSQMRQVRGKEIALVFQDSMTALNPTMTIGAQITEALVYHHQVKRSLLKKRIIDLLQAVGLSQPEMRFKQYPHELSGGMRQRVSIAIAVACHPQLLIADEPTTALDVTIQAQIIDLLRHLQKELKMAVLLITHDLGVVAQFCSKVLVMYAGHIVEEGSVDEIFFNPEHPYTHALIKSVPRLDTPKGHALAVIKGSPPDLSVPWPGCPFFARCPYAMHKCKEEMPPLLENKPGHRVACWLQDAKAASVNLEFQREKEGR